jgi:Na+/H+ antiporter NhaD/arsenite permease-like protein
METIANYYSMAMIAVFVIGYFFITIEHITKINKTTIALLMGIICWILQFAKEHAIHGVVDKDSYLSQHLADISQVIFFLLGALTVVEIINAHQGFNIISDNIKAESKRKLLWLLGIVAFFLSSVLDNLTTTIVMIALLQKLIENKNDRWIMGGALVIAANAGGAWTPIGDVTTTMLWIGGQITSGAIIKSLFLPSLACFFFSFLWITRLLHGNITTENKQSQETKLEPMGSLIFFLGIAALVFVPIFKTLTGLPPFLGILFGLAVLWLVVDIVHRKYPDRGHLRVEEAFTNIDMSGVLFFFGILLCIDALEAAGLLKALAVWLDQHIASTYLIATTIGIASAIVDNVPLVAASMGMYSLDQFPQDSQFWQLIAYCAGTGGSMLIIGSAAGVVFMGLEKVDFFWYVRKISLAALIGYFAGIGVYMLIS